GPQDPVPAAEAATGSFRGRYAPSTASAGTPPATHRPCSNRDGVWPGSRLWLHSHDRGFSPPGPNRGVRAVRTLYRADAARRAERTGGGSSRPHVCSHQWHNGSPQIHPRHVAVSGRLSSWLANVGTENFPDSSGSALPSDCPTYERLGGVPHGR